MQNKKYLSLFLLNIVWTLAIQGTLVFLTIYLTNNFKDSNNSDKNIVILITSFSILNVIYFLMTLFLNMSVFKYQNESWKNILFLSIITLSFFDFVFAIMNKPKENIFTKQSQKIRTLDITFMAMILGMYLLFDYLTSLIPIMPFFISISLKYIPLFFAAYILSFWKVLLVATIGGLISFIMPNNADAGNFWAYIFDYLLPVMVVSISTFIKPEMNIKNIWYRVIAWTIFITVPMVLIYISRVIAGVLFWFEGAWDDYNRWTYSMVFNSFNSIFDYIGFLVLVPPTCETLKIIRKKLN